jgi:hypothetical protein
MNGQGQGTGTGRLLDPGFNLKLVNPVVIVTSGYCLYV